MSEITPLFLMNTTITAESGRTYQIVDVHGKPLKHLILEKKGDSLIIRSALDGTEMEIKEYQKAHLIPPQNIETDNDDIYGWIKTDKDKTITAEEVESPSSSNHSMVLLGLGGLATLGTGVALVARSHRSATTETKTEYKDTSGAQLELPPNPPKNENRESDTGHHIEPEQPESKRPNTPSKSYIPSEQRDDVIVPAPKIRILSVAEDNKINLLKSQTTQEVQVRISDVPPNHTTLLDVYVNNEKIASQMVSGNGTHNISVEGGKLTEKVTVTATSKNSQAQWSAPMSSHQSITVDTELNAPIVKLVSLAELNPLTATPASLPLKLSVAQLDSDAQALVEIYNGNNKIATVNVTPSALDQAGEISIQLATEKLSPNSQLTAKVKVTDSSGNSLAEEAVEVDPLPYNYAPDLDTTSPTVGIISIDGKTNYYLRSTEFSRSDIPIKLLVKDMDDDADGKLTLKVNNQPIITDYEVLDNSEEITLMLSGEQLRQGQFIKAVITATDINGNSATSTEALLSYQVEHISSDDLANFSPNTLPLI